MQSPHLIYHWMAIVAAVVAAFFFGFLWYGPLFGKTWARLMGMNMEQKPDAAFMRKAMILQVISLVLTPYVLAHLCQVWRPSAWGAGEDQAGTCYGFLCGLFTWIGFFIPVQLRRVAWEKASWKLFGLNVAHGFIKLQIICQILANWR